jgi:hypothetical protein
VRIVRAVLTLNEIEDQPVGDRAHCVFSSFAPLHKTNGLIWAEPGRRALVRYPNTAAVATKCRLGSPYSAQRS